MTRKHTIRVRVAVWPDGSYTAYGAEKKTIEIHDDMLDGAPTGESIVWIVAEIPLPEEVRGYVEGE